MEDTHTTTKQAPATTTAPTQAKSGVAPTPQKREFRKTHRRSRNSRQEKRKPEFEQKIVSIRRVTRVMKGGRRFSFSVGMVAGDKKGRVGFGAGKASDTALAIEKAYRQATKKMITVPLTKNKSIAHDVKARFNASEVILKPASGRGLASGSAVRDVLSLAGITDVTGKILSRSKNNINTAKATLKALEQLMPIVKSNNK